MCNMETKPVKRHNEQNGLFVHLLIAKQSLVYMYLTCPLMQNRHKPLKSQTKIAADDTFIFSLYIYKKIRLDVHVNPLLGKGIT